ncbi:MAG: symmetrical bis(5'-nucleosyl)-tetraphosphatase [Pseudomonadales bacterium]
MSTYVFGDLQGCFDQFQQLLEKIHFDPSNDRLWFVGDLINRGPDNLEILEFVMALNDPVIVLGNHELHFLAVANQCKRPTRSDTLQDLLSSDRLDAIVNWMRQLPLVYHDEDSGHLMVHAGLPPMWHYRTCLERASELETVLRGDAYVEFLAEMYGSEPSQWRDDLHGMDRLRIICNYFTRLRYCTHDGKLELTHKADTKPEGYEPWFEFPRPGQEDIKILFGHWAALEGITNRSDVFGLDTGCIWGGPLTAMRLEDHRFFSTPGLRQNRVSDK